MGDDIPIASLVASAPHLRIPAQRFAKVTNPGPSTATREGCDVAARPARPRRGTLERKAGRPRAPAAAPPSRPDERLLAPSWIRRAWRRRARRVLEQATVLDATYAPDESLSDALLRLRREASEVDGVPRSATAGPGRSDCPCRWRGGRCVHEHLLLTGERMPGTSSRSAGDVVDVHDIACLITGRRDRRAPRTSRSPTAGHEGAPRYRKALEAGLLKSWPRWASDRHELSGGEVIEALASGAEGDGALLPGRSVAHRWR